MFWISLTHLRCFKTKIYTDNSNFYDWNRPYDESQPEMQQAFGCHESPGFLETTLRYTGSVPEFEFLDLKTLEDLGLKGVWKFS